MVTVRHRLAYSLKPASSTGKSSARRASAAENVLKVQQALENAGIAFIDESNELGAGVRLRKHKEG